MRRQSSAVDYDRWPHTGYEVRVRGTKYLWGSAGITQNVTFIKAILLHIHNDRFGEAITFGTQTSDGTQTPIGTLEPGEFISIPLQNLSGVFATCALESSVTCVVRH
jgi:hypothetical protein